ncbi:TIM barrel protein [Ancylomarina longa]|uniref:Sugar phosphate isomerase n=1 Tax=Ancylomarina longa TaxID=2487017 RepID=A0A434AXN3_9BACT|nr:TIM barrel protein [Ancylomarina longa]RUT79178.1 sugar phosphate isomerase [Ancylomarina longa]
MSYQNLMDFSVHPSDVNRFSNKWEGLQAYVTEKELDGVELLIGYETPSVDIPRELVKSVHLPFWVTWLEVWRKGEVAAKHYFPGMSADHLQFCCGGNNAKEMVTSQKQLWEYAASFHPAHAVVHAAHVELEHAFTWDFTYKNTEVLAGLAALLNRTAKECNDGEPPVKLAIENLWWPGLDFLYPAELDDFAGRLEFSNWNLLLDTGHLMNTNPALRCEDEAVDFVLDRVSRLSKEAQAKIQSLHLNCSLSGVYQVEQLQKGLPLNWSELNFSEKYSAARNHVLKIDQHLPFQTERVKEIIGEINPDFVVHEFITKGIEEYSAKLEQQLNVLR